ncbi:MAG: nucleotide exchange factor GrpE [Clostridia bacterium]|nr:nucleotide exchange factor GrpE [Clostridia bacterium]MBR6688924.1 nucleotide exchange factor GrpE [Clostridia bacterium]
MAKSKAEETLETKEQVDSKEAEAYIKKLNEDLEAQKKLADEYCDGLKRNMAEFDNYKKRMNKEKETLYSSTLSSVISEMLPIIDNFEKAKDAECSDETYKTGISMIYTQLIEMLKKQGVEKIPDLGETFDPDIHEAVMSIEDETKGEKEIVEVFRTGYRMKDKVVRHSLVKVAN